MNLITLSINCSNKGEIMRFYELLYIARSDLTSTQLDDLNNLITNIIKENTLTENTDSSCSSGNVFSIESWGIKNLAYKSKKLKRNKGHFCLINFSLSNLNILKVLNNRLKINESILRFVIKQIDNSTKSSKNFSKQPSDTAIAS